jgi:hypothetical protein
VPGDVVPVYGQGFFHVAQGVIYYTIVYDYLEVDPSIRETLLSYKRRREEERYIVKRLQELMDEERTLINGREVRPVVDAARIELRTKKTHSATIHVRMEYEPIGGKNAYENFYSPTRAPYDYIVYWIAPPGGKILSVDTQGRVEYEADGRIAVISVRRGERLSGYEAVVFQLP